jgi:hypothetical protein
MNNIFKFATKELTLDAIISWVFNGFKEGDVNEQEASDKAIRYFYQLAIKGELDGVIEKVEVKRQHLKSRIDVYLEFICNGEKIIFVFENKTNTSYHGNQLARHIESAETVGVKAYYFYMKTGFMNWYDLNLPSDMKDKSGKSHNIKEKYVTVDRGKLMVLFEQISHTHILSDMYFKYLKNIDDDEKRITSIIIADKIEEKLIKDYFSSDQGNYSYMANIYEKFSEKNELNLSLSNSIGGRPWSQIGKEVKAVEELKSVEGREYHMYIYWRLDFRNKSKNTCLPYLSLRQYRTNTSTDERNIKLLRYIYKELIEKNNLFSEFKGIIKNGGNQKERELGIIFLNVENKDQLEIIADGVVKITNIFFDIISKDIDWEKDELDINKYQDS